MTTAIALIDNEPTAIESGTLSAMFASARRSARKVMGGYWADRAQNDRYRLLVMDLTNHDDSFGK